MCLATVYRDEKSAQNLVMSNVQRIEEADGKITLTDLMERQITLCGTLVMADLVGGVAVIREN